MSSEDTMADLQSASHLPGRFTGAKDFTRSEVYHVSDDKFPAAGHRAGSSDLLYFYFFFIFLLFILKFTITIVFY